MASRGEIQAMLAISVAQGTAAMMIEQTDGLSATGRGHLENLKDTASNALAEYGLVTPRQLESLHRRVERFRRAGYLHLKHRRIFTSFVLALLEPVHEATRNGKRKAAVSSVIYAAAKLHNHYDRAGQDWKRYDEAVNVYEAFRRIAEER